MRRTNKDRSDTTRAALIAAARRLFVAEGYAATGTPAIVAAAGVTRGALYHHFADKQAIFRAVVEHEAGAVASAIERAAPAGGDPLAALRKGGAAFLDAMGEAGRTRLLLIDAPAVLGRAELDAIDAEHGGRTLVEGLEAAMEAGAIRRLPVEPTAQLLSAMFDRAALAIEAGGNRRAWRTALDAVLDGLATRS
jgi:AcrR family transcriptional regulator